MTNLTETQQLGRAKNAVSAYLDKRLTVPKIFLDVTWNGGKVDVLAIDRAGVGDVHVVHSEISRWDNAPGSDEVSLVLSMYATTVLPTLLSIPCQYKYVLIAANFPIEPVKIILSAWSHKTFPEDGIGRVGILFTNTSEDDLKIEVLIKAERFRSTKEILNLTDSFVTTHTADMEYREPVYEQEATV